MSTDPRRLERILGNLLANAAKHGKGPVEVTVDLTRAGVTSLDEAVIVHDEDPLATNSATQPDRVTAQPFESARLADGKLTITLPAISWTALSLSTD